MIRDCLDVFLVVIETIIACKYKYKNEALKT